MGFSEVSSSGPTAMQMHLQQTRRNFKNVWKERAGRAVAPHHPVEVTDGQSSRKRVFRDAVKLCCESFLLISFFVLLFFITMLLQSHPNHVPRPRHLGICESLSVHSWCKCTRIIHCTLYNQQQGDKDNRNPSIPCVSAAASPSTREKKTHEWPLQEINSFKKKKKALKNSSVDSSAVTSASWK